MAPIIEVSYEVKKDLDESGTPSNPKPPYGFKKGFTYVPSIQLYVEKESQLEENWYKSHKILSEKKLRILRPLEFVIFLDHVERFDEKIFSNITRVRKQWRVEWLDAYFVKDKSGFYALTKKRTNKKKLISTLMEDQIVSFNSLLRNPTLQGLPRSDIEKPTTKEDKLNYIHPENNKVVGFEKHSDGKIILHCSLDPGRDVFWARGCFSLEPEKTERNLKRYELKKFINYMLIHELFQKGKTEFSQLVPSNITPAT